MNKSITELHEMLVNNETTSEALINESLEKCKKVNYRVSKNTKNIG